MPDLSNLLGAVYGDTQPAKGRDPEDEAHVEREPAASERTPAVPDWADDEHLDAAFAEWKPGPPADASPVEQAFVKDAAFIKDADDPPPPLADDLAAALSEALVAASGSADDTVESPTALQPAKRFDFSADFDGSDEDPTEEAEPPQAFAPVHPVEAADEDANLSKSENTEDERAETEQSHELGEVSAPESEPERVADEHPERVADEHPERVADEHPEPVADEHPEPVLDELPETVADEHPEAVSPFAPPASVVEEPAAEPRPTITPQRAAAAELTAASRVDAEPVAATPAPEPEPEPVAAVPAPVRPAPMPVPSPGDGAVAPTTLPAGIRRWEREDDDILPEKQARKFFSFSLRRG